MRRRIFRFAVAGFASFLLTLLFRRTFGLVLPFEAAFPIAYAAALPFAYLLSKYFVFERQGKPSVGELSRLASAVTGAMLVGWFLSVLALHSFNALNFVSAYAQDIATVVGLSVSSTMSFFGASAALGKS